MDKNNLKKYRARLSAIEVVALCIVVSVIAVLITKRFYARELQQHMFFSEPGLADLGKLTNYGSQRNSRNFEEWIIRDFFQDRRDGIFLDVGANHHQRESNTYFLETSLGWSGVAIEPLAEFAAGYAAHRPRTRFVAMFAADVSNSKVQFFVPKGSSLLASSDRQFSEQSGGASSSREVPTTTLNDVLNQAGLQRIDFMSMDIELAEPKALAGFDIERFQPALVCIEAHADVRQQILDYFARHRYTVIGKYLRVDPNNLYFQRLAPS